MTAPQQEWTIGIDLGTSNSCASVWINGKVKVVPDTDGTTHTLLNLTRPPPTEIYIAGRRVTASCVAFPPGDADSLEPVVGYLAQEMRKEEPDAENIVYGGSWGIIDRSGVGTLP